MGPKQCWVWFCDGRAGGQRVLDPGKGVDGTREWNLELLKLPTGRVLLVWFGLAWLVSFGTCLIHEVHSS